MAKNKKTRVVCTINGSLRSLFSITEVSDGGLAIFPNHTLDEFPHPDGEGQCTSSHYSVHKTNGGKDTTLTHKLQFCNGKSLSAATFIENTEPRLLYPVFLRAEAGFSHDPDYNAKSKDVNINIGEHCNLFSSMYYSLFVTNVKGGLSIEDDDFNFHIIDFSYFRLLMFVSFVDLPLFASRSAFYSGSRYISEGEPPPIDSRKVVGCCGGYEMIDRLEVTPT